MVKNSQKGEEGEGGSWYGYSYIDNTHMTPSSDHCCIMTSTRPSQGGAINSIVKQDSDLDRVVNCAIELGIGKEHWAKLFYHAKTILVDGPKFKLVTRVLADFSPDMRLTCVSHQGFRPLISRGMEEEAKKYALKIYKGLA